MKTCGRLIPRNYVLSLDHWLRFKLYREKRYSRCAAECCNQVLMQLNIQMNSDNRDIIPRRWIFIQAPFDCIQLRSLAVHKLVAREHELCDILPPVNRPFYRSSARKTLAASRSTLTDEIRGALNPSMGFVRIAERLVHVGAIRVHVVRRSAQTMIHVAFHARPVVRRAVAVLHSAKTPN